MKSKEISEFGKSVERIGAGGTDRNKTLLIKLSNGLLYLSKIL